MAYKKAADGIVSRGKTKVDVYPNDGSNVIDKGPKKYSSSLNKDMKKMGTNLARAKNQKSS